MAQIFISYRRHDSAYLAASLSDKLQQHFGPNSVFFDVDNIPLGVDFREYIGNAVGQCDVLLVIIGDQWMGIDSQGKRRIDDPSDYVRIEIESALKRNIPVIPVLVEAATMPTSADLPPSIESIAFRNAAEIRAGRDLRQHIDQLIRGLETIFGMSSSAVKATSDEKPSAPEAETSVEKPSTLKGTATSRRKSTGDTRRKTPTIFDFEMPENVQKNIDKVLKKYSEQMEVIRKGLKDCTDSHLYLREAIPPDKLANAISTYAPVVMPSTVHLFFDNTVFGGGKDGLLLSYDAVYWHNISSKPGQINYTDIQKVDFRESTSTFTAAKILINQEQIELNMGDKNKLAEALANVIRHLMEYAKRASGQTD